MGDTRTECCINGVDNSSEMTNNDVTIVTREEWGARPTKEINYMGTPVSVVFIHHTSMNECDTQDQCMEEVRKIQNFHMDDRGWDDIGYNFLIGGDGRVYEGRAWDRVGAHTLSWNDVAVAFSFMGDYCSKLPHDKALNALKAVLELGVKKGKLTLDYKIYGHRNVRETECPGDKLHEHIMTWSHFDHSTPVKPVTKPYKPER